MSVENTLSGFDSFTKSLGLTILPPNGESSRTLSATTDSSGHIESKGPANSENKSEPSNNLPVGSLSSVTHIYGVEEDDDEGQYSWFDKFPEKVQEAAENEETARHAFVIRNVKSYDSRKKLKIHSIIIQSPWLKDALAQILKDYPGVTCELERLVFDAPFEPFVHRWGDLLKFKDKSHDEKTAEHVDLLYSVLMEELKDTIRAFEDYVAHGVITFEHLWIIFQPGSVVVGSYLGTPLSAEFQSGSEEKTECGLVYRLYCDCIDWNGERFGILPRVINLYAFKGTKLIEDLEAFPLAMHSKREVQKHLLVKRGKRFEELAGYHFQRYKGFATDWDNKGNEIPIAIDDRIIVDAHSFSRIRSLRIRYLRWLKDTDNRTVVDSKDDNKDEEFTNNFFKSHKPKIRLGEAEHLICYPFVRGYALKRKKWLDFAVDMISDITWNDSAFDSLVLPSDQKDLILAFAKSQVQNSKVFDDVIQGKGRGMIMLLSGPPGVGKTLTAESIAENMHVPLYTMSAGELGLRPDEVEDKLADILEMVTKWNAVLLLDECDVFLEARSTHDLERNKLVSTFLRVLEYYEGILFLTTNRVANMDAAFQSRIHISLDYQNLTVEARRAIWENFLEMGKERYNVSGEELDELAKLSLNGRQIKNVVKTARLLAMQREGILGKELINIVLGIGRIGM